MSETRKPTVGDSVHFYEEGYSPSANNGMGAGPYAAKVTQVFDDIGDGDPYVNLTVFPPFAAPFYEGSVKRSGARRYEWPPLAGAS